MLNQSTITAIAKDSCCQQTPTPARRTYQSITQAIEIDSASDDEVPQTLEPISMIFERKRVNAEASRETPTKRLRMSDIPLYTPSKVTDQRCEIEARLLIVLALTNT